MSPTESRVSVIPGGALLRHSALREEGDWFHKYASSEGKTFHDQPDNVTNARNLTQNPQGVGSKTITAIDLTRRALSFRGGNPPRPCHPPAPIVGYPPSGPRSNLLSSATC